MGLLLLLVLQKQVVVILTALKDPNHGGLLGDGVLHTFDESLHFEDFPLFFVTGKKKKNCKFTQKMQRVFFAGVKMLLFKNMCIKLIIKKEKCCPSTHTNTRSESNPVITKPAYNEFWKPDKV